MRESQFYKTHKRRNTTIPIVIYGLASLAIAIGISRFGFGVYIDSMQLALGMSNLDIGLTGGANLLGYLAGCIIALKLNKSIYNINAIHTSVIICILSMFITAHSVNVTEWIVMRFITGIASGSVFILVSVVLVEYLKKQDKLHMVPVMYAGVGIGIMLSGASEFVSVSKFANEYYYIMITQSVFSMLLFMMLLVTGNRRLNTNLENISNHSNNHKPYVFYLISISYFLEGMGYIIYATYIFPYDVAQQPDNTFAAINYIVLGLGAMFGPILFTLVKTHKTMRYVIAFLFVLQIISITSNVYISIMLFKLVASFIFGATFMSLTVAFIMYVKSQWPENLTAPAIITVAYSIGQAIGPVAGGYLSYETGSYADAIMMSALFVSLSLITFITASLAPISKLTSNAYIHKKG